MEASETWNQWGSLVFLTWFWRPSWIFGAYFGLSWIYINKFKSNWSQTLNLSVVGLYWNYISNITWNTVSFTGKANSWSRVWSCSAWFVFSLSQLLNPNKCQSVFNHLVMYFEYLVVTKLYFGLNYFSDQNYLDQMILGLDFFWLNYFGTKKDFWKKFFFSQNYPTKI